MNDILKNGERSRKDQGERVREEYLGGMTEWKLLKKEEKYLIICLLLNFALTGRKNNCKLWYQDKIHQNLEILFF